MNVKLGTGEVIVRVEKKIIHIVQCNCVRFGNFREIFFVNSVKYIFATLKIRGFGMISLHE